MQRSLAALLYAPWGVEVDSSVCECRRPGQMVAALQKGEKGYNKLAQIFPHIFRKARNFEPHFAMLVVFVKKWERKWKSQNTILFQE